MECVFDISLRRDGTCVRDYLHVLDLAEGHLLALDALAPPSTACDNLKVPTPCKAYNLGRGKGFSVLQILEAMRSATGFSYRCNMIGRWCVAYLFRKRLQTDDVMSHGSPRRGDVPDLTAGPTAAEEELGFHAKQDLTMCRDVPRLMELANEESKRVRLGLILFLFFFSFRSF